MGEIPTKPGWWVWSETPDGPKGVVEVIKYFDGLAFESTGDWRMRRLDQGVWHHEASLDKPASPWRPASEPPVVPEGETGVEVLTWFQDIVAMSKPKYLCQRFTLAYGFYAGTSAWMPIPPHGEGGAE